MKRSRILVGILTGLAVILAVLLVCYRSQLKDALGEEAHRTLLQFSLITVLGGFVSWVFSELKREADLREARRESLRTFHASALAAHNRCKKLRRLMTAFVPYQVGNTEYINKDQYGKLMSELEEVQLEFEGLRRQVEIAKDLFASEPRVEECLRSMQAYLRKVLREFDTVRGRFSATEAKLESSELKEFTAFIDDTDKPPRKTEDGQTNAADKGRKSEPTKPAFVREFSDQYDEVEKALLGLILK